MAGVGGSFVGTALNHGVDEDVLLLAFSIFMVVAGVAMLRRSRRDRDCRDCPLAADGHHRRADRTGAVDRLVDRCGLMVPVRDRRTTGGGAC